MPKDKVDNQADVCINRKKRKILHQLAHLKAYPSSPPWLGLVTKENSKSGVEISKRQSQEYVQISNAILLPYSNY